MRKKLYFITTVLLISSICFAQTINQKYSYKDFTNVKFTSIPCEEFNNTRIVGTCFYQSKKVDRKNEKWIKVFKDKIEGVVFDRCNLDNVEIPEGNTILPNCSHRLISQQNDLMDWIQDEDGNPVEPLHKDIYAHYNASINPNDISTEILDEDIIDKKKKEAGL